MQTIERSEGNQSRGIAGSQLVAEPFERKQHQVEAVGPSFYRPELDALRFLAFFAVFMFHILPDHAKRIPSIHSVGIADVIVCITGSLSYGVCLFFVLSAYLITTLILREVNTTSVLNLAAFYTRRILRIWPLYLIVLSLAFAACSVSMGFPGYKVIAAYVLFSGNLLWNFHLSGDIRPLKLVHLWSISVEEQFYLLFPGIAKITKVRYLPAVCATFIGMGVAALIHLSHAHTSKGEIWENSFVQFMMFAAGIFIAVCLNGKRLPNLALKIRALIAVSGVASCFSAQYFCKLGGEGTYVTAPNAVAGYLLVVLGCSAFLIASLGFSGRIPSMLTYLGKISYGLYVFHIWAISAAAYLVTSFLHIPLRGGTGGGRWAVIKDLLAFALTVGLASLSYRYIERPFLKVKRKYEVIATRAV